VALSLYDRDTAPVSPRRILLALLALPLGLAILVACVWFWLLHTQSGAHWIWSQVESATDHALSAGDISGDLGSGLIGKGMAFEGEGVHVSVGEVSLAVDVDLLPFGVTILPARVSDLLIDLNGDPESDEESDLQGTFSKLQLPVELVFANVELERGAIEGIGDDTIIIVDSLSLAGRWKDMWLLERFELVTPDGSAEGSGQFALHGANELLLDTALVLNTDLAGPGETIAIDTTVQGSLDDLIVQARTYEPRMFWHGRIAGIPGSLRWELRLEVPAFELPPDPGTPPIPPIDVTAQARGDMQAFAMEARIGFAGTEMQMNFAAEVDIDSGSVSGNVDWGQAHWPVGHSDPQLHSRTGRVTLSGSLDEWLIAGTVNIEVPQLPPGNVTIDGGGDRDQVSVKILEGDILGGSIEGHAEYSWRGPKSYSAAVELDGIRTDAIAPEWPATLSGKVDVSGQQDPFRVRAKLTDITGTFKDRPLQANGQFQILDDSVAVNKLAIKHGETSADVDGELYSARGLRYDIVVDDLSHYVDYGFGSTTASGVISLKPGEESADGLVVAEFPAGQLQLQTRLHRQSQSIELDMVSDGLRSGMSANGILESWDRPSSWSGTLTRLEMEHDEFAASLQQEVAVAVSRQRLDVERFCLLGDRGVSLCADTAWQSDSGLGIAANLSSVPVDFVNAFFDTGFDFDQVVSGEFNWRSVADGTSSGHGDIAMTAGTIVSDKDTELRVETGPARLRFELDDDSLRGGVVKIPLPGLGQIDAEFEILDVIDEGSPEIDGQIDIDLSDVGLLVAFVPALDDAGGTMRADIDIGGTFDEPQLLGDFALERGSLVYLPIGLRLDDIELKSELQANGEIELAGTFRAGDGHGEIRTRVDHARTAAKGLELTVRGDNLTVIDVPDIHAIANTDLRVNFDSETLDLNGLVTIPRARITPANISVSRVYESEDVVIIAGELPDDHLDEVEESLLQFLGSVEFSLGDKVLVDLGVAETSVTGNTVFTWSGDPMPQANGRYDIDGEILAFGQRLEITDGSLRFENVPADNPYLRVRAEREIFGNTQVRQAGVLVAGTLARLTVEPYTTPLTTEERALTLLVTGSDFDYEKGVGAVDIGTYVTPRVYASYGIGLFDNENVIRVRYDLKRGFGVTATSGQKESGVDLSYRFEN
jgi:translocation and assembly module TamB